MLELRSPADQCNFKEYNGKYFIIANHSVILCEITKDQYNKRDYELLSKEFNKYLEDKYPSFWKNLLKYLGIKK